MGKSARVLKGPHENLMGKVRAIYSSDIHGHGLSRNVLKIASFPNLHSMAEFCTISKNLFHGVKKVEWSGAWEQ